jgi:hypothetical protein
MGEKKEEIKDVRGTFGLRAFAFWLGSLFIFVAVPALRFFLQSALVPWWAAGMWVWAASMSLVGVLVGIILIGMSFFAWHGGDDD